MLASESYTCTEWLLSAPLKSSGLTPQFVHINYIPKCVWMALVHSQGLLFQRHANVVHSENSSQQPSFNCQSKRVGDDWDSSTIFPLEYSYIFFNGTYSICPQILNREGVHSTLRVTLLSFPLELLL